MMTGQSYARGVIYVIAGGIFLSSGGLLVRFVEDASPWVILFYRSIVFMLTVLLFIAWSNKSSIAQVFKTLRPIELLVSLLLGIGFICYLQSLFHTSVANTVLVLSTGPLFAGFLAYLVLREIISKVTWLAIAFAIAGVSIMVSGGLESSDTIGIVFAFGAVLSFACFVVLLRYLGTNKDMMPATALGGIMAAAMCVPMLQSMTELLNISMHDLIVAICLGSVQVGFGFIFITLGSRSVPAAQVPLLGLSETALSPIWVWIIVNEVPARNTLIGGALVFVAVVMQGLVGVLKRRVKRD